MRLSLSVGRFRHERLEPAFFGTGEQPIDEARLFRSGQFFEQILARLQPFDRKLLAWPNAILIAQFRGEDDLAVGGNGGFHIGKTASYHAEVNRKL